MKVNFSLGTFWCRIRKKYRAEYGDVHRSLLYCYQWPGEVTPPICSLFEDFL